MIHSINTRIFHYSFLLLLFDTTDKVLKLFLRPISHLNTFNQRMESSKNTLSHIEYVMRILSLQ